MITKEQIEKPAYQDLFDLMYGHYGITLLQSEMQGIIKTCKQYDEPSDLLDELRKLRDDCISNMVRLTDLMENEPNKFLRGGIRNSKYIYQRIAKELNLIINKVEVSNDNKEE